MALVILVGSGLTHPEGPLTLGLESTQLVLLFLSALVGVLSVVPGRSKPLQGALHLVLLATFIVVSIQP